MQEPFAFTVFLKSGKKRQECADSPDGQSAAACLVSSCRPCSEQKLARAHLRPLNFHRENARKLLDKVLIRILLLKTGSVRYHLAAPPPSLTEPHAAIVEPESVRSWDRSDRSCRSSSRSFQTAALIRIWRILRKGIGPSNRSMFSIELEPDARAHE